MDTAKKRGLRAPQPIGRRAKPQPTGQTGKDPRDARGDPSRQARNRAAMGVDENHRTKEMNRKRRGTFP